MTAYTSMQDVQDK